MGQNNKHGSSRKMLVIHREKIFDEDALPEDTVKLKGIVDFESKPDNLKVVLASNYGRLDLDWTDAFCQRNDIEITGKLMARLQAMAIRMGYQVRVIQAN
jgi:hypothetical protein